MNPYYSHTSFSLASRISIMARKKIVEKFFEVMSPRPLDKVVDVGVTSDHSRPESNWFEQEYPFKKNLTCVGVEDAGHLRFKYPGVSFVRVPPSGRLPFKDKQFDLAFSNATIEHVGSKSRQQMFVDEIRRISKRYFICTPSRWCPVDFHTCLPFIHWLPRSSHRRILKLIGLDYWAMEENLRLLGLYELLDLSPFDCAKTDRVSLFGVTTNIIIYET